MPVSNDHSKIDGLRPRVVVGHLVGHGLEGAVGEGAFAFVCNPRKIAGKVHLGCELTEHPLRLGEVQTSDGPADPNTALVFFISQPLCKDPGELLNAFHQDSRRGLL